MIEPAPKQGAANACGFELTQNEAGSWTAAPSPGSTEPAMGSLVDLSRRAAEAAKPENPPKRKKKDQGQAAAAPPEAATIKRIGQDRLMIENITLAVAGTAGAPAIVTCRYVLLVRPPACEVIAMTGTARSSAQGTDREWYGNASCSLRHLAIAQQ